MSRGRTLVLLGTLYLVQGLPFGFFTQALPVLLRDAGYSLVEISASGLLFLPWAVKFLWAPYVDGHGSRRTWLIALQLAAAATAATMATLDLSGTMTWLFVGIAVTNVLAATQDVATDGLAVNLLGPRDRGVANGLQVGAYRVGMILGGGALLALFTVAGWRTMFVAMAVTLMVLTLPSLLVTGPASAPDRRHAQRPHALSWLQRLLQPGMLSLALLLVLFKLGDSMGSALIGPFLHDRGLTLGEIAFLKGTVASGTVLLGAAAGSWLAWRTGRRTTILVGGLLQAAAMGLFVLAAADLGGDGVLVAAVLSEAAFGGVANVALFTLMMDASDEAHAGTDYSLLACAVVVAQGLASVLGGAVGDLWGYVALYGTAFGLSLLGWAVLMAALGRRVGPERLGRALGTPGPKPSVPAS